ncbi:MAG: periplasmic heavy metal sensor [Thermodesulfobacteriota bacterium]
MKTRTLLTSLAVAALLAASATAFAGPGYGPGPGRGGFGCPAGYGYGAELTEEQQAALKTAYAEFAKKAAAVGQDLYAKNLELEAELAKAAPDAKKVAALTKEANDLRGAIFAEQTAFRAKLAKDFGIRGGGAGCGGFAGAGCGGGRGMMGGMMGRGFGPGNCPAWGAPDADDKAN